MIRDLTEGMDGTGIRAGVIGELGVTRYPMGPGERKVFRAAALAQQQVGCAIIAHSAAGAGPGRRQQLCRDLVFTNV